MRKQIEEEDYSESVIKFKLSHPLYKIHSRKEWDIIKNKHLGGGIMKNRPYSNYNINQALFLIRYYCPKNGVILDPFMGRASRAIAVLSNNCKYIGYDTCNKTVVTNVKILSEHFKVEGSTFIHGDGIELDDLPCKNVDAVLTCPPYYNKEKYSGEKGDISYLSKKKFNNRLTVLFKKIYNIIRTSNYEKKMIYPVIFTVGSLRNRSKGLIDMDYVVQDIALKSGFVLHDKMINVNNPLQFTKKRNRQLKILNKIHETTLIFVKYN